MLFSAFYGKEALYVLHNVSTNPEKILIDKTAIRFKQNEIFLLKLIIC